MCSQSTYSFVYIEFEVLAAVTMEIAVVWCVMPCSLVDVYRNVQEESGALFCTVEGKGNCSSNDLHCRQRGRRFLLEVYQTTRDHKSERSVL